MARTAWILLVALVASGCGERCVNREIQSLPSPSGKKAAVVFSRECSGAEPNVQVSVTRANVRLPNVPGNAFIVAGQPALAVRWLSEESLSISGYGTARVHKQESTVADTTIHYAPAPPP
ncbi:MAG TPA: hypothetical protein VGD42_11660 [Lysobacter sp.]